MAYGRTPGGLQVNKFEEMKGDNHAVSSGGITRTKEMLSSLPSEGPD